jgi:23S rRNA (cytidine1920-2'-O)/16S rRNA (cytidine1409-2'-O)-methyltransferase
MPIVKEGNKMRKDFKSSKLAEDKTSADFVSRAEFKIQNAVEAFHYDFRGKTVLDIGSSTGGFTEYALSRGAKKVVAVEIGTNQMKAPLRFDPRIDLREKTDIFKVNSLENIDTIMGDVSFVSLKKVLLHAKNHFINPKTDFLMMLKPQFEAKPFQLKNGVVKNEKIRRDIIKDFENWLRINGFVVKGKRDNSLAGRNGNIERFYLLKVQK